MLGGLQGGHQHARHSVFCLLRQLCRVQQETGSSGLWLGTPSALDRGLATKTSGSSSNRRSTTQEKKKEYHDQLKNQNKGQPQQAAQQRAPQRPGQQRSSQQGDRQGRQAAAAGAQRPSPPPPPPQPLDQYPSFGRLEEGPKLREGSIIRPSDTNTFVHLNRSQLGEAFEKPEVDFRQLLPRGGCKGLQDEWQTTGTDSVLYRQVIRKLIGLAEVAALEAAGGTQDQSSDADKGQPQSPQQQRQSSAHSGSASTSERKAPVNVTASWRREGRKVYLSGPPASGKSIALAALVSWARSQNWVVLYIPHAQQLTHGGFFPLHAEGVWDTPESAKLVLQSLVSHHATQLESINAPGGENLAELAQRGLQDVQGGDLATQVALDVQSVLFAQTEVPVLVAIDNYEALYLPSEYGEWLSQHNRRKLMPSELRLASSLQVLDRSPPARGLIACADGGSRRLDAAPLPMTGCRKLNIPRFDFEEWKLMLSHYGHHNKIFKFRKEEWKTEDQILAYHVHAGNFKEMRSRQSSAFDAFEGIFRTVVKSSHSVTSR